MSPMKVAKSCTPLNLLSALGSLPLEMSKAKKRYFILAFIALLFGYVGLEFAQRGTAPLRDSPLIEFPRVSISQSEIEKFLEGDFHIITDMKALPKPVGNAVTETAGARLTIANPGQKFEATDVIRDQSLPRKRLLFAGVAGEKCFMLYEQGGIAHFYVLALFKTSSADSLQPIWRAYCRAASSMTELRSNVSEGRCSDPVPSRLR
jgi:hypothetical protein